MLYSAHPAIPSKTVPSTYTTRPCSITSAPHISQSWEDNSSRLSPTLHDSLPVLPVMIPLQTSYMEEAWVEIRLEVHSLEIDDGSSDTCPALNGPNPLIADLLPYCLTNFSQNELHGGRSRSLSSISGHESYPEYLFEGFAGDDQGFFIANFALFVILVPTLLLLRSLSHRLEPLSFTRSQPMRYRSKPNRDLLLSSNLNSHKWGLGFAKISQIYERFRQSLEPEVSAGKTRIRWKCVSRPFHF